MAALHILLFINHSAGRPNHGGSKASVMNVVPRVWSRAAAKE